MRFLADESCDFRVVSALRSDGNDVLAVAENSMGASDLAVIAIAARERRVTITEERDFGRLVFADGHAAQNGILFIRCPESIRPVLGEKIAAWVRFMVRTGMNFDRRFVVWKPEGIRIRRLERSSTIQSRIASTTRPCTSVRRKSRPW